MARDALTRVGRGLARRAPAALLRAAGRARGFGEPFGSFERDDGSRVELLSGYRDAVKASWRVYWWSARLLYGLRGRIELPPELEALAAEIERSRTLPLPPAELAAAVQPLAEAFPEEVRGTGRRDKRIGAPVLELLPRAEELERQAAAYAAQAQAIAAAAARAQLDLSGARVLDAGTGSGYLAFALAGLGAAEVVAVDLDPETYVFPTERTQMRELLARTTAERVRLEQGDVHRLGYGDGSFDLVCSLTAVEHFADARAALLELARVLRPGGVAYHAVDPWFGKRGGHSLCTLDFPWGHVRLTEGELERYLDAFRPHERADALDGWRHAFQRPPLTLAESRAAFEDAGVHVLEWRQVPLPARDPHRAVLDRPLLQDCRRFHPRARRDDLLTVTYTVVGRA